MLDEKFIDGFIEDAEKVSPPNSNVYFVRGNQASPHHVGSPLAKWVDNIWSSDFQMQLNLITKKDKVFIHWYDLDLGKLLLTLDKEIPIHVALWGGDFYEDPFLYHIHWLLDKLTLKYVKKHYVGPQSWSRRPHIFVRQLWSYVKILNFAKREFELKTKTVQRINFILIDPNNTAEVELTRKLYKASHLKHLPLNYNQNVDLANSIDFKLTDNHQVLNIQLGNSATEANNHVDCLQVIRKFKNENIKLIIPLAYGRDTYAKFVKENANELFVDKVVIHERFISREEYVRNLNEVDIGIMYHNRSQAFGNCVTLLSLGKKLFLKSNNPLFTLFNKVGIKVFDANLIRRMDFKEFAEPLSEGEKQINISLTLKYFSNERRLEYLEKTLNYRDASLESAKSTEVLCNGK